MKCFSDIYMVQYIHFHKRWQFNGHIKIDQFVGIIGTWIIKAFQLYLLENGVHVFRRLHAYLHVKCCSV